MPWHRLEIGDPMLADAQIDALARQAAATLASAQCVALRHESTGDLHCQVVAYFSPGTAAWATSLGARPCPIPPRNGLSLLSGDDQPLRTLK